MESHDQSCPWKPGDIIIEAFPVDNYYEAYEISCVTTRVHLGSEHYFIETKQNRSMTIQCSHWRKIEQGETSSIVFCPLSTLLRFHRLDLVHQWLDDWKIEW